MTIGFRIMVAAAALPLVLLAPAAHAQFLIDEREAVASEEAAMPTNEPVADADANAGTAEPVPPAAAAVPVGSIGSQAIRDVAERLVGSKRAAQVGQIEAVARDVLGKDAAGAASSVGVADVLPLVGDVVKGLRKKKP